ncbi:amidohydrolase family protein [Arthrobacter nitrophenolicus]|nr:amidohydrolase family protein [Arthrobacter nitrophenolicus]
MIIESHAHLTNAPQQLDAFRGRQVSNTARAGHGNLNISDEELYAAMEKHVARMDRLGIDLMIFSPRASGMSHEFGNERISFQWAQANNNLIARAVGMFPGRLFGAAQLPQSPGVSPANCIEELDRCILDLGFVGCLINPDVSGGGQPFTPGIGDPWWYPLYQRMIELDVPGLFHASSTINPALHLNGSHYTNVDSAVVFELCWTKVLDELPGLKVVVPHGGGALPFHYNRIRSLLLGAKKKPLEERLTQMYLDTAVYDRDSLEMLVRKVGPGNLLYAAEPFGTAKNVDPQTGVPFDETIDFVSAIDWLSADEKERIFSGNALRLYSRMGLVANPGTARLDAAVG